MSRVVVALGSNLGDRHQNMAFMRRGIKNLLHGPIVYSALMETEPVGVQEPQTAYLNQLIEGSWNDDPHKLLTAVMGIEAACGRRRNGLWASRTADIDIITFDSRHIATDTLTVPHPQIKNRLYLILGLLQLGVDSPLAPHFPTPGQMLDQCPKDVAEQQVQIISPPEKFSESQAA